MEAAPQSVSAELEAAGIAQEGVGIQVHDLHNVRTILSAGAQRPLKPASAIKLVVTFAALELLGPAYTWKTAACLLAEVGSIRESTMRYAIIVDKFTA